MIEKILSSDVVKSNKNSKLGESTPIKPPYNPQQGLTSQDLDKEKGFVVSFSGASLISEMDKEARETIRNNMTPQAHKYLKAAENTALKYGNKEIHQLHFQYEGLKKVKEYINLLNKGEINFDNNDEYFEYAEIISEPLNKSIYKSKELRNKILPVIDNQLVFLEKSFEALPKAGSKVKNLKLTKSIVNDIYNEYNANNVSDEFGAIGDGHIGESYLFNASFITSDYEINKKYTRPFFYKLQESIMLGGQGVEEKSHISLYDDKAKNVLKNLSIGTNMFVLHEKESNPAYIYRSLQKMLDNNKNNSNLSSKNTNLLYLNKWATYSYLNSKINELSRDKDKNHVVVFNLDNMDKNPSAMSDILTDKLTDYIPDNIKYVIFSEKDTYYNLLEDTGRFYDYGEISIPMLTVEQAKKAFKEEPLLTSKIKKEFQPKAIDAVVSATANLDGAYPEKALKIMQKISSRYVNKEEISANDVNNYVKEAGGVFKSKGNNNSVNVVFDTGKRLKDMLGANSTKAEIASIIRQIKQKSIGTKGFLIYPQDGYPGGGRRHSAQVIAGETKSPYVEINALDFGTKEVSIFDVFEGKTIAPENAMKKVFSLIKSQAETSKNKSAVLFVENFEYFTLGDQVSDYHQKAMSQMLKEMDTAQKQGLNIIVMGSVASGNNIGESTMKSFKFVDKIEVESVYRNPDARKEIIENYLKNNHIKLEAKNDKERNLLLSSFADTTHGFAFIELMTLLGKTKNLMKERGHKKLTKGDFIEAYLQVTTGRPSSVKDSEHSKRIVASHECGHALNLSLMYDIAEKQNIPWHLPEKVNFITLDPRGIYGGAMYEKNSENREMSFEKMFANLVCSYGGHSSEKILYNQDGSWGISGDLEQATQSAYAASAIMAQGHYYGKKSINTAPFLSESAKEKIDKDVEVFTQNALLVSDLIVKCYRGFVKDFTDKYAKLVGTGDCLIMSETFKRDLLDWKKAQNANKKLQLENLEKAILKVIESSKKGKIINPKKIKI